MPNFGTTIEGRAKTTQQIRLGKTLPGPFSEVKWGRVAQQQYSTDRVRLIQMSWYGLFKN